MMAKNPSERFASLKAVADEISDHPEEPGCEAKPQLAQDQSATRPRPPVPPVAWRSHVAGRTRAASVVAGSEIAQAEDADGKRPGVARGIGPQMFSRRDFEQVIQIIERIPEKRRNAALQALLEKSRSKVDEISFLICDIDEAVRLNDRQRALKKAEELLQDQAGPSSGTEGSRGLCRVRRRGAARIGLLQQFTQPWNEGGWIPWSVLAFGLAVFGVMAGVIIVWLGKTAIVIDTQDAGITVTVKGESALITVPGKQSIKVEPGDQTLTISYAGLETNTKSFTIKKGQTKIVTVSILNSEIVARLEGEIAPPTLDQHKTTAATPPPTSNSASTLPPTFKNSLGMEFVLVPKGKSWLGGGGGIRATRKW